MVKLAFYPKFIREIISHIPTIAFKTIHWKEFLSTSTGIVKNYLSSQVNTGLHNELDSLLDDKIHLVDKFPVGGKSEGLGQEVLRLYFLQLKNPEGLYLDLRSSHFTKVEGEVYFKPNSFYFKFKDNFRTQLVNLYKGFYYEDEHQFENSLKELGMTSGLSHEKIEELKTLFKSHFGDTKHVKFNLDEFNESFLKIFEFFMDNKITLETDFIYLGAYLVTLYMHLGEYEESFDVESIFKSIF
jgi:hypothetical protein